MTLKHVAPGDPLSASQWNELVDGLNGVDYLTDDPQPEVAYAPITINNPFDYAVSTGDVIPIGGMRSSALDADACYEHYLSSGFQLRGTAAGADAKFFAFAEEGIPAGEIGHAFVPYKLAAAFYYEKANEVNNAARPVVYSPYVILESAYTGALRVIAKSAATTVSEGSYTKKYFAYFIFGAPNKNALTNVTTSNGSFVTSVSFTGGTPITSIPTILISHTWQNVTAGDYGLPAGVVSDVSVDSNGDLVVTKQRLSSSASLDGSPGTAGLSAPTGSAITRITKTSAEFLYPGE